MSDSSSNDSRKKAKRQVTVCNFEKWQCELDHKHHMWACVAISGTNTKAEEQHSLKYTRIGINGAL